VLRAPRAAPAGTGSAATPAPDVTPAAPTHAAPPTARAWAETARTVGVTTTAVAATTATATALAEPAATGSAAAATAVQGQAVAAVGTALSTPEADRPPVPRPTRPQPRRRPWTVRGLHVLQLVVWEVAVAAVLAVHRQPPSVLVPVAAVAVLAVALTAVRLRGRWLYSWVVLWVRYRTRQRSAPLVADGDASSTAVAEALLGSLSRGAHLDEFVVDEQIAGLVVHAGGVSALIETSPGGDDPTAEAIRTLPPLTALLPPADAGEPSVSVQLLVQTVPAPAWVGDDSPAAVSYRQLTGGTVPARRRCWVALQVLRSPDDGGLDELRAALANSVRRVRRQLHRADLRTQLLGPDDLVAALLGVAGLEAGPDGSPVPGAGDLAAERTEEAWTTWRAGELVHSTFRLLDWPLLDQPAGQQLVDRLGTTTTVSTTIAVAARRVGAEDVELATSLRVVLPVPDALPGVTAQLAATAADCGARVQRLDGRQVHGMAAAMPFGGFLR
jgi:type VII secretion protein EccE